jgi:hypothetical protein
MTLLAGFSRSLFIHRETLILENLALRQQLEDRDSSAYPLRSAVRRW